MTVHQNGYFTMWESVENPARNGSHCLHHHSSKPTLQHTGLNLVYMKVRGQPQTAVLFSIEPLARMVELAIALN